MLNINYRNMTIVGTVKKYKVYIVVCEQIGYGISTRQFLDLRKKLPRVRTKK